MGSNKEELPEEFLARDYEPGEEVAEIVTPEEKLFRLIASANRNDQDVEELILKYTGQRSEQAKKSYAKKIKAQAEKFWTGAEVWISQTIQEIGQRPKLARSLAAAVGIILVVLLIAKGKSEKNFYFYSDRSAYEKFLPEEVSEKNKGGVASSSVVVPVREAEPYRLVGISWDSQGLVAMIEGTAWDRAKFVRKGDELAGGVKVSDVKESSVTLESGSRKWQLS